MLVATFFLTTSVASTAFVFSSSWTLPLYAALRGSVPPTATKRPRRRSFRMLIAASVAVAVALVLPLCLFAQSDNNNLPVSTPLFLLDTSPNLTGLKCRALQAREEMRS